MQRNSGNLGLLLLKAEPIQVVSYWVELRVPSAQSKQGSLIILLPCRALFVSVLFFEKRRNSLMVCVALH